MHGCNGHIHESESVRAHMRECAGMCESMRTNQQETKMKNSASTTFGQLVVNRYKEHFRAHLTAMQTPVSITKQSVMRSTDEICPYDSD